MIESYNCPYPEETFRSWYYDQTYIYFINVYTSYFRISESETDFKCAVIYTTCTNCTLYSFITLLMNEKKTIDEYLVDTKLSKKERQSIVKNKNDNFINVIILKIKSLFLNERELQELKFLSKYFKFKYYLVNTI